MYFCGVKTEEQRLLVISSSKLAKDIDFVEYLVLPLLSCTKETDVSSQDLVLPLFSVAHLNVLLNKAHF